MKDKFIKLSLAAILSVFGSAQTAEFMLTPRIEAFEIRDISDQYDWRQDDWSIEIKNVADNEHSKFFSPGREPQVAWSPDSNWLVLKNARDDSNKEKSILFIDLKQKKIFSKNLDSKDVRFNFRSDGELVIFHRPKLYHSDRFNYEIFDLLIVDIATQQAENWRLRIPRFCGSLKKVETEGENIYVTESGARICSGDEPGRRHHLRLEATTQEVNLLRKPSYSNQEYLTRYRVSPAYKNKGTNLGLSNHFKFAFAKKHVLTIMDAKSKLDPQPRMVDLVADRSSLYPSWQNNYRGHDDLSARIVAKKNGNQLKVHLDVRDDLVLFKNKRQLDSDHAEIWLSIRPAEYGRVFTPYLSSWFGQAHFGLYKDHKHAELLDLDQYKKFGLSKQDLKYWNDGIVSKFSLTEQGYAIDFTIDLENLPFYSIVGNYPQEVSIIVDVIDVDETGKQETLLSTTDQKTWGKMNGAAVIKIQPSFTFDEKTLAEKYNLVRGSKKYARGLMVKVGTELKPFQYDPEKDRAKSFIQADKILSKELLLKRLNSSELEKIIVKESFGEKEHWRGKFEDVYYLKNKNGYRLFIFKYFRRTTEAQSNLYIFDLDKQGLLHTRSPTFRYYLSCYFPNCPFGYERTTFHTDARLTVLNNRYEVLTIGHNAYYFNPETEEFVQVKQSKNRAQQIEYIKQSKNQQDDDQYWDEGYAELQFTSPLIIDGQELPTPVLQ